MRMFLVAMCDIFLILYLTAFTSVAPKSILTVDDFSELKLRYETLQADTQQKEAQLILQLEQERLAKQALAHEKKDLTNKLDQEKDARESERDRLEKLRDLLVKSRNEKDTVANNLHEAERMLAERQRMLNKVSYEVITQEQERRQIEMSYQEELKKQRQAVEKNKELLDQMQKKTELAIMAVEEAKTVQKMAVELKDEALKAKEEAENRAVEALAKSYRAEVEMKNAIKALNVAKTKTAQAEKNAERLSATIEDIKQDGKVAYGKNVKPHLQQLNVTYTKKVNNDDLKYERELKLLPVKIDDKVYIIFPSKQIGFRQRSNTAPNDLKIVYQGKKIAGAKFNKNDDLIAIEIVDYNGKVQAPYPKSIALKEFMPTLLSLRNDGNRNLFDSIRGLSDDYYIVKRDYLEETDNANLQYTVTGFRGTGEHGERIVQGDQLADLNGRLIGIAADADKIIRIDTVKNWEDLVF